MDIIFLEGVLSFITLLLISGFVYVFCKRYKLPFTIILALVGVLLIPLLKLPFLSFIGEFKLTPELLFFIFLPVLLFESGYNIKYTQLKKNWKSIGILAIFGVMISAAIVGYGTYFLLGLVGWHIPLEICLLFGIIISATDPVAVLGLFKDVGAPPRLALIFEGESLFNDGTAFALFLVMFEIINKGVFDTGTALEGFATFLSMIIGGLIFGLVISYIFSLAIGKIKNNEVVEISMTMVMAHFVFLLSELVSHHLHIFGFNVMISGVIATSVAAIFMGNYGKYKISPKVEQYMHKFWSFFAFIANSLVFILMGLILHSIDISPISYIIPVLIAIVVVMIARAISVYIPIGIINFFKMEEPISKVWQKLLAWGSLRGGLGLMMVFLIPDNFTIQGWEHAYTPKEFLLAITIGSIFFTLFVKAPTIGPMLKKHKMNTLNDLERLEKYESNIRIFKTIIEKIESINRRGHLNKEEYKNLIGEYQSKIENNKTRLTNFIKNHPQNDVLLKQAVGLHALGVEKQYLKQMYKYKEVNEDIFRYVLTKIEKQMDRLQSGVPQIKSSEEKNQKTWFDGILKFFGKFNSESILDNFVRYRAQAIVSNKVIYELEKLKNLDCAYPTSAIDTTISLYRKFNKLAEEKMEKIHSYDSDMYNELSIKFINKHMMTVEDKIVEELHEKEQISDKLYHAYHEEIEKEIYTDVKISN